MKTKASGTGVILPTYLSCQQKLVSPSKKEWENFIQAKFEDYNKAQLQKILETKECELNDVLLTVYMIQI